MGRLERCLNGAGGLVFLCSGNVVRSAYAELEARRLGLRLPVRSVATRYRNAAVFPHVAAVLVARGVPEPWVRAHRPTHLADVAGELPADAVAFGMRRHHLEPLAALRPDLAARAFLLPEVCGAPSEIADPIEEGADLDLVLDEVARCVAELHARLGPPDAPASPLR